MKQISITINIKGTVCRLEKPVVQSDTDIKKQSNTPGTGKFAAVM